MICTHISFSYASLVDFSIDGRCWGTVMNLQVDDFPFRQEQAATSEDKQSKTKPMPPRQKAKPVATSRWFGLLRSWSWGCHLLSAAAGTVPFPAASIFCSSQQNVVPISIRCWHVHITWMGPIAQWLTELIFFPFNSCFVCREDWYLCPFLP